MDWVKRFDFVLFDFDGLLVDTEALHYQAYKSMLAKRGCQLDWSFGQYCMEAHREKKRLQEAIYAIFPKLYEDEPRWTVLKSEKNKIYKELLLGGSYSLMPGVEKLLSALEKNGIPSCIVTNSTREQIEFIREKFPVLKSITNCVTIEQYSEPKPSPEGFLKAITLYGKGKNNIVGFEDSVRGIWSLQKTPALPVLIAESMNEEMKSSIGGSFLFYPSFESIDEASFS